MNGQAVFKAAADKLGMSVQDLQSALRSGKSLSYVAKEKNVLLEDVLGAMSATAKTQLDQAVQAGKLTEQQEKAMLDRIPQGNSFNFFGKQPGQKRSLHRAQQ